MNPSQTLRELAQIARNPIVQERLTQLAAEFELQHNQQNNNWGVALGMAQNTWEQALADLRSDLITTIESRDAEIVRRLDVLLARIGADQGTGGRGC